MLKNKRLQLFLFALLIINLTHANDDAQKTTANLQQATVFFNGAELTHSASAFMAKGVNDVWISDLSPNIDINSLKIKTTQGVIVASYEYSLDHINKKEVSPLEKKLNDSIKYYQRKIDEYNISRKTNKDLLNLLEKNNSIAGTHTGLTVAELAKMVEFYKAQSIDLHKSQYDLKEKEEKAKESQERIKAQLTQESAKNVKTTGVLKLNLTSPLAVKTDFEITYFTRNANWIPYYDINVSENSNQIQIAAKAKVAQTTGLDWNKVKLSLSTTTPSNNREAPLFNAWFLDYYVPNISERRRANVALSQNSYSYSKQAAIPMALESQMAGIHVRGSGSTDNAQPLYIVNGEVFNGDPNEIDPSMINDMQVLKDASSTAIYGSRGANGVILITTKSLTDFVDRTDSELNAVYNIELPYTIQGNRKTQNIDLQAHTVSAEIKYYSVPKLDQEVFVLAEIADWQKLGLLSGKANVTYGGTYVGETEINAASVAKNLSLTLGTDKRIIVKREKLQDFSSQKFLGRDTQQDFTYKITVRNNQNRNVKMVLKDQYPLTNQKDIQIEVLNETTPTSHINEEVGVLNWEFDLSAGESKEFKVAYRVKYPKDRKPTNLN